MPNEKAGSIWRKFANYESKYGDMTGIERVEKRWRDAFPGGECEVIHGVMVNTYAKYD